MIKKLVIGLGKYFLLMEETFYKIFLPPVEKKEILNQMYEIGVKSFPVCFLTSFFVGMVLALQSGTSSIYVLNEPLYVGTLVTFSLVKELGPVLTATVLIGRVGAAITAELGSMRVSEQIDAMYTLGTDPVKYLIIPRIIAFTTMLPILVIFSNLIGIFGGLIVSYLKLDIPTTVYVSDCLDYLQINDFLHGFVKSIVFGLIVATISCYKGFYTEGGAEGVGKATTSSVVTSIVSLLVGDYFISSLLVAVGIG
jgi:phospholipid/cholesterol/gamma-HCH transport system permease protein